MKTNLKQEIKLNKLDTRLSSKIFKNDITITSSDLADTKLSVWKGGDFKYYAEGFIQGIKTLDSSFWKVKDLKLAMDEWERSVIPKLPRFAIKLFRKDSSPHQLWSEVAELLKEMDMIIPEAKAYMIEESPGIRSKISRIYFESIRELIKEKLDINSEIIEL